MVRVNSTADPIEVMTPNPEGENNCPQLQVMRQIVRLMRLHLPRSVGNNMPHLHQYRAQTRDGRIAIHHKIIHALWQG